MALESQTFATLLLSIQIPAHGEEGEEGRGRVDLLLLFEDLSQKQLGIVERISDLDLLSLLHRLSVLKNVWQYSK